MTQEHWEQTRQPELAELWERHLYDRIPGNVPAVTLNQRQLHNVPGHAFLFESKLFISRRQSRS